MQALKLIRLIAISMLILNINASYANGLEIINLEHRPAREIIPVLQPLLKKNESISGEKYVIFIRASDNTLQQLKKIIPTLDADYRVLSISIIQESIQMMKRYGYQQPKNTNKSNSKHYSTQHLKNNLKIKTIKVTEGQWATLQTGISIPSLSRSKNADGTVTESIHYQSIYTRLKIQPIIIGKNIKIQMQSFTGDKNNINNAPEINTRVTGQLGKWIALGSIISTRSKSNSGFTFSTQRTSNATQQLFIKVEITSYQD